jgi:hypothetical protein
MSSPESKRRNRFLVGAFQWVCGPFGVVLIFYAYLMAPAFSGLPVLMAAGGGAVATAGFLLRNTTVMRTEVD